jgi:hypothetical protein
VKIPKVDLKDRVLLIGVAIALGSAWMLGRIVFFVFTLLLGLVVIWIATTTGEE